MNLLRGSRLALSAPASLSRLSKMMADKIQEEEGDIIYQQEGDIIYQHRMAPPHCSSGAAPFFFIIIGIVLENTRD